MSTRTSIARQGLVLAVMCVGMFLVLLDVTVVNVALPSIRAGLAAGPDAVQWVVDAYAVAIAGGLLAGGTVGDRLGHRRVAMAGLGLFGLASLACGLAPTVGALVGARAVQGVGAALLLPTTLAVINDTYPDRAEQARALGIWAGVSSLALPAGPLLGGLLVTVGGWPLVFLVNVPIVIAAVIVIPMLVPRGSGRPERALDLPGLLTAGLALGGLVFAVIDVGRHGLRAASAAAAVLAVVAGVGFVARERHAEAPMLPISQLAGRGFVGANLAALTMNMVINGILFVTTLYLQDMQGRSPLQAGLALLPLFAPLAVLAPVAGRLTARYGPRLPMMIAAGIAVPSAAGLLAVEPDSGYLVLAPTLLGLGVAGGLFTASVVAAAVRAVPADRSGLASGVNNTARQTGTALGVAVFGAVVGAPSDAGRFVGGVHALGVLGAALWLGALVLSAVTVESPSAVESPGAVDSH
jgi:MFS transporter, DHA2 family, methylenomycin A resistance protein